MKWIKENKEVVIVILVSIIAICAIIVFIRLRVKAAENKIQDTNNQLKGRWNCYRINEKEAKNSFFSLEFDGEGYSILYNDWNDIFYCDTIDNIEIKEYVDDYEDTLMRGMNYDLKRDNQTIGFSPEKEEYLYNDSNKENKKSYQARHSVIYESYKITKITKSKLALETLDYYGNTIDEGITFYFKKDDD